MIKTKPDGNTFPAEVGEFVPNSAFPIKQTQRMGHLLVTPSRSQTASHEAASIMNGIAAFPNSESTMWWWSLAMIQGGHGSH